MGIMSMNTFETKLTNYADEHTLADIDSLIEDLKKCRKTIRVMRNCTANLKKVLKILLMDVLLMLLQQ